MRDGCVCAWDFCSSEGGGGGCSVVDCSKPEGGSVDAWTNTMAPKFKCKGIDDVIVIWERGDFMICIDIKDAYKAFHFNPEHRTRQGMKWQFKCEDHAT